MQICLKCYVQYILAQLNFEFKNFAKCNSKILELSQEVDSFVNYKNSSDQVEKFANFILNYNIIEVNSRNLLFKVLEIIRILISV